MSRLLSSAIAVESQPEPQMSLEDARSWFYQNQLDVQEQQFSQESIVQEIEELNRSSLVLESIQSELMTEVEEKGALSFESCHRLDSVLKAISGNDDIAYAVSMESANDDPEAATTATMESLTDVLSKAKDYLGDQYRALMEKARWMERGFFDVAKKHRSYIDGLQRQAKSMDEAAVGEELKVSSYVQNYLHVNGNTDPSTILDGLKTNNAMMSDVIDMAPEIRKSISKESDAIVKSLFDAIANDEDYQTVEKMFDESIRSLVSSTTDRFAKTMGNYTNKSMLGGKVYQYVDAKLDKSFSMKSLVAKDDNVTKAESFTVASKDDVSAILDELKTLTGQIQSFKDSMKDGNSKLEFIKSMATNKKKLSDSDQLYIFVQAWLATFVVTLVVVALAIKFAPVEASLKVIGPILIWTSRIAFIGIAFTLIKMAVKGIVKAASGSQESMYDEAASEYSVKQIEGKMSAAYVSAFSEIASHINVVLRAGLEYSHASIEAAGVKAKVPDVDTSQ